MAPMPVFALPWTPRYPSPQGTVHSHLQTQRGKSGWRIRLRARAMAPLEEQEEIWMVVLSALRSSTDTHVYTSTYAHTDTRGRSTHRRWSMFLPAITHSAGTTTQKPRPFPPRTPGETTGRGQKTRTQRQDRAAGTKKYRQVLHHRPSRTFSGLHSSDPLTMA